MSAHDWDYANDIREMLNTRPPRAATNVVLITSLLFLVAGTWAYFATLQEVTRGGGRIVPSRQIQVVQAPEKGVVKDLLVDEGDIVDQGQVLVRIDDTDFSSQLGEVKQKRFALMVHLERLEAETSGNALVFSSDLEKAVPELVQEEKGLYRARKLSFENDQQVLESQLRQKEQEYEELLAKQRKLETVLAIMSREVEINKALFERRVLPEIEFLKLQRQFSETNGELEITKASLAKTQAARMEAQERVNAGRANFLSDAQQDLSKTRGDLAVLEETIKGARDRVRRTDLVAPVRGVVNRLDVTTIGAVVQPGSEVLDIVPLDDTLLVETRIKPRDVAFLSPGLKAMVKITAYDYSIYGGLEGKLERISADTSEDGEGNRFYRVMVRTNKNFLGSDTDPLPIIPGMVASVDILTGEKSVLDYILKPIKKVRDEALRER